MSSHWLSEDLSSLNDLTSSWVELKSVVIVKSQRHIGDKITIDTRCFISLLKESDDLFFRTARRHWIVENELHWLFDVIFREDETRIC